MNLFDSYQEQGYVIVNDVIDKSLVSSIFEIFNNYLISKKIVALPFKDFDDKELHNALKNLRKENPNEFSILYDSMQTNAGLMGLTYQRLISETLKTLFPNSALSATGHMIRMDAPEDLRNTLNWHQEIPYYPQNEDGNNAAVMWFPLNNHTKFHGPVIVAPESHKLGKIELEHIPSDGVKSEQYVVPEKYLKEFKEIQVVIPVGSAVIFNMNLFHSSGFNSSDEIRFSGTIRYHNMAATDWAAGKNVWKPR